MQNHTEDEKYLVSQLVKGDESAFCELYAAYKNRLMYFALRMLKSPVFAEDVFQNTFGAVWKCRSFIDPNAPFGPYVYTIMRNRILNMLTEIDRDHSLKEILTGSGIGNLEMEEAAIQTIISKDIMELLESAIRQLPARQQKVFRLSREEYLSHKEIADRMNISVHTAKTHSNQFITRRLIFTVLYLCCKSPNPTSVETVGNYRKVR